MCVHIFKTHFYSTCQKSIQYTLCTIIYSKWNNNLKFGKYLFILFPWLTFLNETKNCNAHFSYNTYNSELFPLQSCRNFNWREKLVSDWDFKAALVQKPHKIFTVFSKRIQTLNVLSLECCLFIRLKVLYIDSQSTILGKDVHILFLWRKGNVRGSFKG